LFPTVQAKRVDPMKLVVLDLILARDSSDLSLLHPDAQSVGDWVDAN
jgi:hypothetical protein